MLAHFTGQWLRIPFFTRKLCHCILFVDLDECNTVISTRNYPAHFHSLHQQSCKTSGVCNVFFPQTLTSATRILDRTEVCVRTWWLTSPAAVLLHTRARCVRHMVSQLVLVSWKIRRYIRATKVTKAISPRSLDNISLPVPLSLVRHNHFASNVGEIPNGPTI